MPTIAEYLSTALTDRADAAVARIDDARNAVAGGDVTDEDLEVASNFLGEAIGHLSVLRAVLQGSDPS